MSEENNLIYDFEQAINFLNIESNLQVFEKSVENYLTSNQENDITKFINFQVSQNFILGNHFNVLFFFLKNNEMLPYEGRHKEIYRRLINLRQLSNLHFILMDNAINFPDRLKSSMFTFNEAFPEDFLVTWINNNNSIFRSYVDFSGGLNLVNHLLENLIQKLDHGHNNIEIELFQNFNSASDRLISKLNTLIQQQNSDKR